MTIVMAPPRVVTLRGETWSREVLWWDDTRLATPAFWAARARENAAVTPPVGGPLAYELALCILGGHGVTEEMALLAFARLRDGGLLDDAVSGPDAVREALLEPLESASGRRFRYRYPVMKAERLAAALAELRRDPPEPALPPVELRDWLTRLPGVGMKTASWVVRNLTRSDDVAIIDIHIRRAGVVAGVFDPEWLLPRDYRLFEEAFVQWARAGEVPTAHLDVYIWSSLARLGNHARRLFGVERLQDLDR